MSNDPPLVAPNATSDMLAPQIPSDFGGTPTDPSPASLFANNVQQAGQFTPGGIKTAVATGQQRLTTAPDGKPCATCDKTGAYSLAFDVKDANGKMCGEGMYYTVKYETSGEVYTGSTDANGITERYFSNDPAEKIYLYLGHRQAADRYPMDRSGAEDAHDEAPLASDTVAVVAAKKIHNAQTQRLWKPWTISRQGEEFTASREALRRNAYDLDGGATRNVTIGIGRLVHHGPFVMNQQSVDQVVDYLNRNGTPVTVPNIVQAVGPATGLTGRNLTNAQGEMQFVNGVTDQEAQNMFLQQTYPTHRRRIPNAVFVPLYQYEYDTLADLTYNRGEATMNNPNDAANRRYASWLNRGRYYYVGNDLIRNNARRRVPTRRDAEADLFLNGNYAPHAMNTRDYQPGNRTPWNHVPLTP